MSLRYAGRMAAVRPSAIRELLKFGADPELVSFGGGYPDPALFPVEGLRETFDTILAQDANVLQYTFTEGNPRLRAQVAARMAREGVACEPADVLILQGAQQGLDLVARMLIDPGDVIVTEDPTFVGAIVAFNAYQPRYAPVRTDEGGLDPDDLERVLEAEPRAKLLYLVPDFQNPTGVTLTLERRRRILELAARFDLVVLEDSPYRDLRYEGVSVPPLRSLDADGRVVYLGSFSKILAPGMRLGWAVAGGEVGTKLTLLKTGADTQTSTLNMAAASWFLDHHDIDAHIATIRDAYRAKRDLMLATIDELFPPSVTYTRPEGGLFTWLTFPEAFDTGAFLREVAVPEAKVSFVPGAAFYAGAVRTNHARLNFSGVSDERMVTGLSRLAAALRGAIPG